MYKELEGKESTETRVLPEDVIEHIKSGQPDENMLFFQND